VKAVAPSSSIVRSSLVCGLPRLGTPNHRYTRADKNKTKTMAAPTATRHTKIKSGIWAAGFFAVITVGTLTGAMLKNDQQKADVRLLSRSPLPPASPPSLILPLPRHLWPLYADQKTPRQAITKFRETTPAEQIAMLEDQKLVLLDNRAVLQRKLDAFQDRVQKRDADKQSGTTRR
jgi:hypothetical protein